MDRETTPSTGHRTKTGIAYTIVSFLSWGILPLYWKHLEHVPAHEILAHRILWSFLFVMGLLALAGRWRELKQVLTHRTHLMGVLLCSLLITANWFIYIWAVNADHVVEASLGYYINPLLNVALGVLVLKERLDRWQMVSLALAFTGVTILTLQVGNVPWVALSLALTFALYGLAKKLVQVDSLTSLALETTLVTPLAAVYLLWLAWDGIGSFGHGSVIDSLWLAGAGIVTALPLLWFAEGAKRVSLTTVGFLQYLSPTLSLLIGVLAFGEPFTPVHWISFGCIWSALAVFTLSRIMLANRSSAVAPQESKAAH